MKKLILVLTITVTSSAFAQNFFGHEYQEYLSAQNTTKTSTAPAKPNKVKTIDGLEQQVVEILNRDDAIQLERLIHNNPKVLNLSLSPDVCEVDDCIPSLFAAYKKKKQSLKVLVRHGATLALPGGMPGDAAPSVDGMAPQLLKQIQTELVDEKKFSQKKTATRLVAPKDSSKFVLNLVKEDDAQALDEYLIKYPQSIDYVDHNWNLLQWSCEPDHKRPNAAKVLLRHGMDPTLPHEDDEQAGQGLDEPSPANLCPALIDKLETELRSEVK